MSWAALANNQMVSRDNLQNAVDTGVLRLKNTITGTGTRMCTKADITNFVYVDTTNTTYAGYASNQLVPKSVIFNARDNIYSVAITETQTLNTTYYCSTNVCGNSGSYSWIQNTVTATLKNPSGNTITNYLGYQVDVNFDGVSAGCFSGTVPFSASVLNGNSSGAFTYNVEITTNCGDPDAFCCTTETIYLDCITSVTNSYSVSGPYSYCGSPP